MIVIFAWFLAQMLWPLNTLPWCMMCKPIFSRVHHHITTVGVTFKNIVLQYYATPKNVTNCISYFFGKYVTFKLLFLTCAGLGWAGLGLLVCINKSFVLANVKAHSNRKGLTVVKLLCRSLGTPLHFQCGILKYKYHEVNIVEAS